MEPQHQDNQKQNLHSSLEKEGEDRGGQFLSPPVYQFAGDSEDPGIQLKSEEQTADTPFRLNSSNTPRSQNNSEGSIQLKTGSDGTIWEGSPFILQRNADSGKDHDSPIVENSGSGEKLPFTVQAKMEEGLGADFSDVRVHPESNFASQMNAKALTQGKDLHFAPGQFQPESQKGQELIGHELTHVVQQSEGRVQPTAQLKGQALNNDQALEQEADQKGAMAAAKQITKEHSAVQAKMDTLQSNNTVEVSQNGKTVQRSLFDSAVDFVGGMIGGGIDWLVGKSADFILSSISSLADLVGFELPQSPWEALVKVIEVIGKAIFAPLKFLIPKAVETAITGILAVYRFVSNLIDQAMALVEQIRAWFEAQIAQSEAKAREELAKRGVPEHHLEGVWNYLYPMLETLYDTWWESVKSGLWELIWPIPGVWEDIQAMGEEVMMGARHIWNLDFSLAGDAFLNIWQKVNSILGRLYGWISLAIIATTTIAGALAGGIGAIPGFFAGVEAAFVLGEALLISTLGAEAMTVMKGIQSLRPIEEAERDEQVAIQNEIYYEDIAGSSLTLAIIGIMVAIGALAARIGKAIMGKVRAFFKRPARNRPGQNSGGNRNRTRDYENHGGEFADDGLRMREQPLVEKDVAKGGAARAAQFGENWPKASLKDAIRKFAPDSSPVRTKTGKTIYRNPETGIQVVFDESGNYFRIQDTNIAGRRSYLDFDGNIPNNKVVDGKQMGRSQGEYNQVTHFGNLD